MATNRRRAFIKLEVSIHSINSCHGSCRQTGENDGPSFIMSLSSSGLWCWAINMEVGHFFKVELPTKFLTLQTVVDGSTDDTLSADCPKSLSPNRAVGEVPTLVFYHFCEVFCDEACHVVFPR